MQCSGVIIKTTTHLHLVLILLCQVRPFVTRRVVKEDNGRPVRRIHGTGTIGCQNSALARLKFYDIKNRNSHRGFAIFTGKCLSLFLIPVNIAKFLRAYILSDVCERILLKILREKNPFPRTS